MSGIKDLSVCMLYTKLNERMCNWCWSLGLCVCVFIALALLMYATKSKCHLQANSIALAIGLLGGSVWNYHKIIRCQWYIYYEHCWGSLTANMHFLNGVCVPFRQFCIPPRKCSVLPEFGLFMRLMNRNYSEKSASLSQHFHRLIFKKKTINGFC